MANYGFIIDGSNARVVQYNHDSGVFIRDLGQANNTWSPYYVTNFDPTTGLPLGFALGPTDFQDPCGLATDGATVYALDTMTCRVLRFDTTGTLVKTFGGKRGIGTGRITPDSSKRSIISIANGTVWVTDNAGGFVTQYSAIGTFQNDYSIATWATASGLTNIDQITGIAWDAARGHYWALAQDSTNCWLFRISANGIGLSTGVINLTTRLGIPGHNNTPAGRLLTRGLRFFGSYLYLSSQYSLYRVDLQNPDGDLTVYTDANGPIAPGWIDVTGAIATVTSTAGPNGNPVIQVISLPGGAILRGYALAAVPPTGTADHVSEPWDNSVVPYAEDPGTRISNTGLSSKARILATTSRNLQLKANLQNRTAQTLQLKARITAGTQKQTQLQARIDLPPGDGDSNIYEWQIDDSFGNFTRSFTINYRKTANVQVGNQVDLWGGYDTLRLHLMEGTVDNVTKVSDPNATNYIANGRDVGAIELQSTRVTNYYQSRPPGSLPLASLIIKQSCALVGIQIGALEYPDYPLWASYSILGKNILEIATDLMTPWNLFASVQYVPVVRNKIFSILKIDWQNPPAGGCPISRSQITQISRRQEIYQEHPRLNEVKNIIIRGAAYRALATNLGIQTKIEYYRTTAGEAVQTAFLGEITKPGDTATATKSGVESPMVITETVTIEKSFCDKLLTRDEKIYSNSNQLVQGVVQTTDDGLLLTSRTQEQYYYIDPLINGFGQIVKGTVSSVNNSTLNGPGQSSLLWVIDSTHSGIVDITSGGVTTHWFQEDRRTKTETFYDINQQVAMEQQVNHIFDTTSNQWVIDSMNTRTHSQVTGGAIRTQLLTFTFDNSVFKTSTVDHQTIGGSRPNPNDVNPRGCLVSHQVQSPQGQIDSLGHVIDFGSAYYNYQVELPYSGQVQTDQVYQNALNEQTLQLSPARWEIISASSIFNPNIRAHEPVSIEVESGVFINYWCEGVTHRFETQKAVTEIRAKRITTDIIT